VFAAHLHKVLMIKRECLVSFELKDNSIQLLNSNYGFSKICKDTSCKRHPRQRVSVPVECR